MIATFAEAYTEPRRSARGMVLAAPSRVEMLMMVTAGYAIANVVLSLMSFALPDLFDPSALRPEGEEAPSDGTPATPPNPMAFHLYSLSFQYLQFLLIALLAWGLGTRSGGRASFQEVAGVVAWHGLASSVALPFILLFFLMMQQGDGGLIGLLLVLGGMLYILYMFSAFLAEVHGFENVGLVMLATVAVGIGAMFFMGLVFIMLVGAPIS